ncbi:fatty acid--CoA ligase [Zavarzinia sp. CC-PAN008]|uniref:fatty acid--CoA ligase n=1 Tax=Zavarzinia sp. CC-PAN008 TaxID=3243332 RepID=UPI003F745997
MSAVAREVDTQDARKAIRVLADIPRVHARLTPRAPALLFQDRVTDFATLDRYASQVANGLIAAGVAPQGRIGVIDKNSDWFFETYLGTAKANVVLVGINWRLAPPEVAYVINDAKCEVLFVGPDFAPLIDKIRDQIPTVRLIVSLGEARGDWPGYAAWRDGQKAEDPMLPVTSEDIAVQMYTSGTTGHPKGVQLSNANMRAALDLVEDGVYTHWSTSDVGLCAMPNFHVSGANVGMISIYVGAGTLVLREFEPNAVLDAFQKHRVTKAFFVPAAILLLLQNPRTKDIDFSALDYIGYGASPIPLDLLRQGIETFKCKFVQCYGLTETSGTVVALLPEDHDPNGTPRMRSCGKPCPGVEIKIIDGDGNEAPTGAVGEILIKSPHVMTGYWNLPEATAKSIRDGWFYSGDAGYVDGDGYLYIHDRVKDMIVSGAENIYPAEVESALFGHPAIADVAVIGVPDEKWGEAVKAIVVLKPGMSVTPEELIARARERIAGYKVPKSVDFIDAMPRNPSGKLLKRELRAPYWAGRDRQVN